MTDHAEDIVFARLKDMDKCPMNVELHQVDSLTKAEIILWVSLLRLRLQSVLDVLKEV